MGWERCGMVKRFLEILLVIALAAFLLWSLQFYRGR